MIFLVLCVTSNVQAWGTVGHDLIASLASKLLTDRATAQVRSILDGRTLASIASWADRIKWLEKYKYTSELHYINSADDNPPEVCKFTWQPPGHHEIIAAIYNYTGILKTADETPWKRSEALRFLVHYMEDLHQPLHRMSRDVVF